jgi:hypothetical protein
MRRRRRALHAGVHVGLVVKTDIQEVMSALRGARKRLHADVVGATVAAEGDELVVGVRVDLALRLQRLVHGLHAGDCRGGVLEGDVYPRMFHALNGKIVVETSRQPVAFAASTGFSVDIRICRTAIGSPQPGQRRWPPVRRTSRWDSCLRFAIGSPPTPSGPGS